MQKKRDFFLSPFLHAVSQVKKGEEFQDRELKKTIRGIKLFPDRKIIFPRLPIQKRNHCQ